MTQPLRRIYMIQNRPGHAMAASLARAFRTTHDRTYTFSRRISAPSRYLPNSLIVNIGSSNADQFPTLAEQVDGNIRVLNCPESVQIAADKLRWFRHISDMNTAVRTLGTDVARLSEIPIPEWTDSRDVAQEWLGEGRVVVARTLLRANGGRGIVIVDNPEQELPRASLYTQYVKKRHEYRVHVFLGQVICVQQKRRRGDSQGDIDSRIRNHDNGWVFCVADVDDPNQRLLDAAVDAVTASGLDFGAVDVGWNEHYQQATVYEVNTGPVVRHSALVTAYHSAIEDTLKIPTYSAEIRPRSWQMIRALAQNIESEDPEEIDLDA